MKKILVDTDVIIDYLRRQDKTKTLFFQIFSQKEYLAVISLITITELWAGKSIIKKETLKKVEAIIRGCKIILPTIKTAKLAGRILRQANYQISFQDAVIASQAIEEKIMLLTLNNKDFEKIKEIRLYSPK